MTRYQETSGASCQKVSQRRPSSACQRALCQEQPRLRSAYQTMRESRDALPSLPVLLKTIVSEFDLKIPSRKTDLLKPPEVPLSGSLRSAYDLRASAPVLSLSRAQLEESCEKKGTEVTDSSSEELDADEDCLSQESEESSASVSSEASSSTSSEASATASAEQSPAASCPEAGSVQALCAVEEVPSEHRRQASCTVEDECGESGTAMSQRGSRPPSVIASTSLAPLYSEQERPRLKPQTFTASEAVLLKESEEAAKILACGDEELELMIWGSAALRNVFNNWRAQENEVRIDDLPLLLADLGVNAEDALLEQALAGILYVTLDWTDVRQVIRDYMRLERQQIEDFFSNVTEVADVSALLSKLGYPGTAQAASELLAAFGKHGNRWAACADFQELVRELRRTEGFRERDLQELRSYFDREKIMQDVSAPLESIAQEKVWRFMMLKGFPASEKEVQSFAEELYGDEANDVSFRQMLKLIRCLKEMERTQTLELIETYDHVGRNGILVDDLRLALGSLGYYPDEDSISEYLCTIGKKHGSEDSLTAEELEAFLHEYRQCQGFTREQVKGLSEVFAQADSTGRGQLNSLELTKVLRWAGFRVSLQDSRHAILPFDEGTGLLSMPEVLKLIRRLHAQEAEARHSTFLSLADESAGQQATMSMKELPDAMQAIRGHAPEPSMLRGMMRLLGAQTKKGLSFEAFEHVCKLLTTCEMKFMRRRAGFTPEEVTGLRAVYQSYGLSSNGSIPESKLPQLLLHAFPTYATSARQQLRARAFVEDLKKRSCSLTFDDFLRLVRLAEDEAELTDFEDEDRVVQELKLERYELEGFRDIYVKAAHGSTLSYDAILEVLEFATEDFFSQSQHEKLTKLLQEADSHKTGDALHFPDFLRFMKRLTDQSVEKELGILRASLRQQQQVMTALRWKLKPSLLCKRPSMLALE